MPGVDAVKVQPSKDIPPLPFLPILHIFQPYTLGRLKKDALYPSVFDSNKIIWIENIQAVLE